MGSNTTPGPQQSGAGFEGIVYRLQALEQEIVGIRSQLAGFVPTRENDLHLKNIQQSLDRIERDLADVKQQFVGRAVATRLEQDLADLKRQLAEMSTKQAEDAKSAQELDAAQRARQDALQILALRAMLGIFVTILVGVLIAVITHRI